MLFLLPGTAYMADHQNILRWLLLKTCSNSTLPLGGQPTSKTLFAIESLLKQHQTTEVVVDQNVYGVAINQQTPPSTRCLYASKFQKYQPAHSTSLHYKTNIKLTIFMMSHLWNTKLNKPKPTQYTNTSTLDHINNIINIYHHLE